MQLRKLDFRGADTANDRSGIRPSGCNTNIKRLSGGFCSAVYLVETAEEKWYLSLLPEQE